MATTAEPTTTTTLTMGEAINTALREALDRPEPLMLIGQDIGPLRGHVRRHARALRGLRRGADPRRAAVRVGDRRLRHRPRRHRRPRGVRDRVLRLRRRRDGPDLQPGREAPLLHGRQAHRAPRDPHADRRPDGHGPAALAEPRVVVHAHSRDQDRRALERGGRLRPAADSARRPQPGPVRRERSAVRTPGGGRPGRGDPVRPRPDRPGGHRRHGRRALGHGRRGPRGRRAARRARDLDRGDRPAHARAARHGDDPPARCARRCGSPSPTTLTARSGSAPRSQRAAWRRRSTTSTLPWSASPALDVPIPCTPSGIEAVYPSAEDVVVAVERLVA